MSWQDNIKEAAYTSPSGKRMTFEWENVSRDKDAKGSVFEFTDADGTYAQTLGKTLDRLPLIAIFSGPDCDTEADEFYDMMDEKGFGTLEHPRWGVKNCAPLGKIAQRHDLKTSANENKIQVTFYESLKEIYPEIRTSDTSIISKAIEDFNKALSDSLGNNVDLGSDLIQAGLSGNAVDKASAKGLFGRIYANVVDSMEKITRIQGDVEEQILETTGPLKDAFDNVQSTVGSVQTQFNTINSSIITGLDRSIGEPVTLARQTLRLIQTPGRAFAGISEKLSRYQEISTSIINEGIDTLKPGQEREIRNNFYIKDMFALGAVSGSVSSAISSAPSSISVVSGEGLVQFQTRTEAVEAAEQILSQFESVTEWREQNFASLELLDTGEAYQQAHKMATLAAGKLIDIAFTLKQERSIILDRARNIVELEFELYGTVDDNLDFLITANELTGDEILELPRGREIKYYV